MNLPRRVEKLEERATQRVLVQAVPVSAPLPLEHPADVLALLAEQANAVRADTHADPLEKARTLGLLVTVALRSMEARDLHARLEAVERILKLRRSQERETNKLQQGRR